MVWCKEDVATISLRYMINDQLGKGEKHCCYEKGRGRQKKKKKKRDETRKINNRTWLGKIHGNFNFFSSIFQKQTNKEERALVIRNVNVSYIKQL